MSQLFETMINQGYMPFIGRLRRFLKSKGKDIDDYTDDTLYNFSRDDMIYVYSDILEVDGFEEFVEKCNLVDTGRYSKDPLTREAIILSPKNNNIMFDQREKQFLNFSERYRRSKLYHLSLPKYRNSIIINGLRPKSKRFNSEEDGSENYDGRVYFIVKDLIGHLNKTLYANMDLKYVVDSLKKKKKKKRKYFGKYDIWEVTLPDGVELHRDPKFDAGGFVTCNIPPKFIRLVDEKIFRRG